MYDYPLHRGRRYFCLYCLQAFGTADVLKCHIKVCFKIIGKQRMKMSTRNEPVTFHNYEKKIKAQFLT